MPRAYDNTTRTQQQLELKNRIAAAAAWLHKARGALGTSYADIAREAGVSLPTMYKHYPTMQDLLLACTSHVAQQAPPFPTGALAAAPDLATLARELVKAMDKQHAHFGPWLQWREHRQLPVLAELGERQRSQVTAMLEQLLARHAVPAPNALARLWEALLHYEFWDRLVNEHGLSRSAARDEIAQLLLCAAARGHHSRKAPK